MTQFILVSRMATHCDCGTGQREDTRTIPSATGEVGDIEEIDSHQAKV